MKKFTAVEWQSFSSKKDIEAIAEKLKDNHGMQVSLIIQIAVMLLGVALQNIFEETVERQYFWITVAFIGVSPFLYFIYRKYKKNKLSLDIMEHQDFIDIFDNKIIYDIQTSESFCTMLSESLQKDNASASIKYKEMLSFYYIQASYYFQKAITALASIDNIADKVLSSNKDDIMIEKLISLPRYKNAKHLLMTIFEYLEANKNIIEDELTIELNQEANKTLINIDNAVSVSHET